MPAGTGASKNVTWPRGRGRPESGAAGSVMRQALSSAEPRDSANGMDSSLKRSSRASRAARSGTAKSTEPLSDRSWRTRPSSLVSEPAMPGWRTGSSAVTAPDPARRMDEKESLCWRPKSICRGGV